MRRALALLLLLIGLAPGIVWRVHPVPRTAALNLRFVEVPIPPPEALMPSLGPFTLEGAWRMDSRHLLFGGYSALILLDPGELLALSDRGGLLRFSPPGGPHQEPWIARALKRKLRIRAGLDIEAATADLANGTLWTAIEGKNSIIRHRLTPQGLAANAVARPRAMADWGSNTGAETLVRLQDGRFLALREAFQDLFGRRRHAGLLFVTDPVENGKVDGFSLVGPAGFSPTDAAQLPDGRILILFRRLDWPFPARFSARMAIGDPGLILPGRTWKVTQVAILPEAMPLDNFEALALEPRKDGKLVVWLMSDDNRAAYQATYLWKLAVDPEDLPGAGKKARGKPARPSEKLD